jgi:hypothetical protein
MKSFSKATFSKLIVSVALVGGVLTSSSTAHATACDAQASVRAPSASQPTSLSITGMHIRRESMDALWEITTSEDPGKFVVLGHAIGAAHDWFGNCSYPGIGIGNGSGFDYRSKNVTLWLWHSEVNLDLAREAIYELIGETESAAQLVGPVRALTGRSVVFDAADSMPAFTDVLYSWDLDGDGDYEVSTGATSSVETTFASAGVHGVGVKVSRPSGATRIGSTSITVMLSPNSTSPGISILDGQARVNGRDVVVNMVWPEYATTALVSNDGAFHPMRTNTIDLSDTFAWTLEDGGEGVYSTSVFVRFVGPGIDSSRTYWDTIVLDATPVTTTTTTVPAATTTTTTTTTTLPTSTSPEPAVMSQAASPNAGETVQAERISRGVSSMSTRALSAQVARSSQQVTTKVLTSSRNICRISGRQVLAIRSGQCRVKVTVRTTNGRTVSRVLTFMARR